MLRDTGASGSGGPVRVRRDNRKLYAELRRALHRREFALNYQPQVTFATGAVRCWEALLRWPGRPEGPLPPAAYLGAAERSDVGNEIGGWTLMQACVQARAQPGVHVSVNIAGRQLFTGVLVRQVEAALALSGLAPERLDLEVSERVPLHSAPEAAGLLATLRALGVGVVLDDFGHCGADLTLLDALSLTAIKLDPALVQALPERESHSAAARLVIDAAHARGLIAIAEGLETEQQRDILIDLGCDEAQGFLIAAPMPPDRIWERDGMGDGTTLGTCSAAPPASETGDDRVEPHRSRNPGADAQQWS